MNFKSYQEFYYFLMIAKNVPTHMTLRNTYFLNCSFEVKKNLPNRHISLVKSPQQFSQIFKK